MAKVCLNQAALLPVFLVQAASIPFRYGHWDCAMLLANWWRMLLEVDPAPDLRGSYSDEAGWKKIAREAGGLTKLIGGIAEAAGGHKIGSAVVQIGDIGVVRGLNGIGGGIWVGSYWIAKSVSGMSAGATKAYGCWSLR